VYLNSFKQIGFINNSKVCIKIRFFNHSVQAFLLALVDLLIDLGVIMTGGKRRKRNTGR